MTVTVPGQDLRKPILDRQLLAVWTRGHVAVDERIRKLRRLGPELARQLVNEPSFPSLHDRTGVVSHEPTQMLVRLVNVPQKARTVERMESGHNQVRRIPDVVQPSGGLKQVGAVAEYRRESPSLARDTLRVRPAARQRALQVMTCELACPLGGAVHVSDATGTSLDIHGRRGSI